MGWDTGFVKLGLHTVRGVLRSVGGRVPKKRYKELLAGVVAVVLAEHPDLDLKEARKRAERVTGNRPAADLIGDGIAPAPATTSRPASRPAAGRTTKKKTAAPRRRPPAPAGSRSSTARRNTRKPTARKRTTRKTARR